MILRLVLDSIPDDLTYMQWKNVICNNVYSGKSIHMHYAYDLNGKYYLYEDDLFIGFFSTRGEAIKEFTKWVTTP
jgi:hypothetical protein